MGTVLINNQNRCFFLKKKIFADKFKNLFSGERNKEKERKRKKETLIYKLITSKSTAFEQSSPSEITIYFYKSNKNKTFRSILILSIKNWCVTHKLLKIESQRRLSSRRFYRPKQREIPPKAARTRHPNALNPLRISENRTVTEVPFLHFLTFIDRSLDSSPLPRSESASNLSPRVNGSHGETPSLTRGLTENNRSPLSRAPHSVGRSNGSSIRINLCYLSAITRQRNIRMGNNVSFSTRVRALNPDGESRMIRNTNEPACRTRGAENLRRAWLRNPLWKLAIFFRGGDTTPPTANEVSLGWMQRSGNDRRLHAFIGDWHENLKREIKWYINSIKAGCRAKIPRIPSHHPFRRRVTPVLLGEFPALLIRVAMDIAPQPLCVHVTLYHPTGERSDVPRMDIACTRRREGKRKKKKKEKKKTGETGRRVEDEEFTVVYIRI
ncbi:hypothetical protein PUN28_013768 [Cardiocondyla obscurior]|uniref:Ribosomal protein S3 n=1 Tax=Cardiocondyla obscurior TaxID=286306 RepID=A0AAW2F6Z0_9HYME